MKNSTKFLSFAKLYQDFYKSDKLVSLSNSYELLVLLKRLGWRLISLALMGFNRNLSARCSQVYRFGKYLLLMRKRHGDIYTVKYLKACQLAVQKRIALDQIKSLRDLEPDLPLPRLSTSRLPRFIPLEDRRSICAGSPNIIRYWLTIFSLYRVIGAPGTLKLSTIEGGYTGSWEALGVIQSELPTFVRSSFGLLPGQSLRLKQPKMLWLASASPGFIVSWFGLIDDIARLAHHGLLDSLNYILRFGVRRGSTLIELFEHCSEVVERHGQTLNSFTKENGDWIGQLQTKDEPAGKIRVFAMVDIWTQICMRPLHKALFSFLRDLPNDGTHDQHASVQRCFEKAARYGLSFGYDLSAATDRLPIALQQSILESLLGFEYACCWGKLLVGRPYWLTTQVGGDRYNDPYWYAVGQPMGALSSWAMLAVTHHMIVQLAARRAGAGFTYDFIRKRAWFEGYELLGDDLVIFSSKVAHQYLLIMEAIGVPINRSKSVVARNGSFEFAKVTGYLGYNVSAISWRMFISQNTHMGRVNIAYSFFRKGMCNVKRPMLLIRTIVRRNFKDFGDLGYSYIALMTMMSKLGIVRYEDLYNTIFSGAKKLNRYWDLLAGLNVRYMESWLGSLVHGKSYVVAPTTMRFYNVAETIKNSIGGLISGFIKGSESKPLDPFGFVFSSKLLAGTLIGTKSSVYSEDDRKWVQKYIHSLLVQEGERLVSQVLRCYMYRDLSDSMRDYLSNDDYRTYQEVSSGSEKDLAFWIKGADSLEALRTLAKFGSDCLQKLDNRPVSTDKIVESPLRALQFFVKTVRGPKAFSVYTGKSGEK